MLANKRRLRTSLLVFALICRAQALVRFPSLPLGWKVAGPLALVPGVSPQESRQLKAPACSRPPAPKPGAQCSLVDFSHTIMDKHGNKTPSTLTQRRPADNGTPPSPKILPEGKKAAGLMEAHGAGSPPPILKVLFFWHYFALSFFGPFVAIFLSKAGLSPSQIALVNSLRPVFVTLSIPTAATIADKLGKHKAILMALLMVAPLARLSLLFTTSMWGVILVILLSDLFGSPVEPMIDSTALGMLPPTDQGAYGRVRVFATLGWSVCGVPLAGWLLATYGQRALFYAYGLLALGEVFLVSRLKVAPSQPNKGSLKDVVTTILASKQTVLFFLVALLVGQSFAVLASFQYLLLRDLGDKGMVMGLATLITTLTEAPMFMYGDKVINKLGFLRTLQLILGCMAARLAMHSTMTEAWMVLGVEWMHGIIFGLLTTLGTNHMRELFAGSGMGATAQGFMMSWMNGVGTGTGSFAASVMAAKHSTQSIFGNFSAMNFFTLLSLGVANVFGLLGKAASKPAPPVWKPT
mmetsp:Transcript_32540/g.79871  ORF Transcript_32540/g.79871 Transcript_32540/m.79871 type:complete len:522 (+) Transcript_32540:135-1700(+)